MLLTGAMGRKERRRNWQESEDREEKPEEQRWSELARRWLWQDLELGKSWKGLPGAITLEETSRSTSPTLRPKKEGKIRPPPCPSVVSGDRRGRVPLVMMIP